MKHSSVVWIAITVHFLQGISCFLDSSSLGATPIHPLVKIGNIPAGVILLAAAFLAARHLLRNSFKPKEFILGVGLQQVLLIVTGWSSFSAIIHSSYADLVTRPHGFIFCDQILTVIITIFHTGVVIYNFANSGE